MATARLLTHNLRFAWGTHGLPAVLLEDGDVKLLCIYTNIIIAT